MAGQGVRGFVLLLVVAFLCPIFAKKSPSEPRVYCPVGSENAWNYLYPGEWGKHCPLWSQCTNGSPSQSPVNFPPLTTRRVNGTLALLLSSIPVQLIRFGDYLSLPVTPSSRNAFKWRGQYHWLNRVEFHAPSEHTINGVHANFEIQLYFSSDSNKTVAVAFLYTVGTCPNDFLSSVLPYLPRTSSCSCGNGRVENFGPFSEECDDGERNGPTARCRSNCKLARCGDGITDPEEACDEGLTEELPNRCRPDCELPTCGDGVTDNGEQCDDGNNLGHDGCSGNCTLECGDGCLQPGEECDEGAANSDLSVPNSFTTYCRTKFCLYNKCGDGIVDFNEQCDQGTGRNESTGGSFLPNSCRPNCTLPRCGDGVIDTQYGEYCEPPNSARCSSNCTRIPVCGDGILDSGEQCDSGGVYTRTCNADCTLHCGDGKLDPLEECDNGNSTIDGNSNTRPNSCRNDCLLWYCGDGVVDLGCEQCDDGPNNNDTRPNACRSSCTFPICGDGVLDEGEECDDNNTVSGDGCSCCQLDCGNGILESGEQCDEGVANSDTLPDRCRSSCVIHYCGDGVTDFNEECDFASGHVTNCSTSCTIPFCGDGIIQSSYGEECDNGDDNSYYDLSPGACSPVCTLNFCGQTLSGATADIYKLAIPPVNRPFFYVGSESHPPCSETIEWLVSRDVGEISLDQLNTFQSVIGRNNRPTQRVGGRALSIWAQGPPDTPNDYRFYTVCGNGIVEQRETCDDGVFNSDTKPNSCRTTCQSPYCGDQVTDSGEECDGGDHCTPQCTLIKYPPRRNQQGCWTTETQGTWDSCQAPVCNNGANQSPIRLPDLCQQNSRTFNLNHPANIKYNPTPLLLFNTGSNILFPTLNGGTFNFKGVSYLLDHIEFKQPSEHYIGTKQYPLEVQLFHKSQAPVLGQMAVLSVLFEEGDNSTFLKAIFDHLPPFSDCHCGNGLKEAIQTFPGGKFAPEQCDCGADNNDHTPNSCRTNCKLPHCGDGVVDSCETCDQGMNNYNLPNKCRTTCVLPFCGDGITDDEFGETCDDGNNLPGDGCNSYCQKECGDGEKGPREECDHGHDNNDFAADSCRTTCRLPRCGDGVVDSGEECDNGNANSDTTPDACRLSCTNPRCGDRITDPSLGETCDGGIGCDSCQTLCGNGVLDVGEQCDNGTKNGELPGACRPDCSLPRCGDGVIDPTEQCDDGPVSTRRCTRCQLLCGNGVLDAGEECDDGGYNSDSRPNACRTDCTHSKCGDGILDSDEQCDEGAANDFISNACRPWCKLPRCGDGVVDSEYCETCDDGNNFDGDGCSAECQLECGNGRVDPGEDCDNGAQNSNEPGSCCRTNCKYPRCGDGIVDHDEECDNGNNSFGPNTCRPDCTLPKCGDGIVDHNYGEVCDQGNRNSWTTVDGCSPTCSPNVCRQSVWFNTTVNPADVLPTASGVYTYSGSLNSPPCTENVEWFVFTTPSTLSTCQLEQFTKVLSNNNRCLQPRNQRPVTFLVHDSVCGDGMVEGNEECDNGPENSNYAPNACRRDCRRAHCGDGVRDAGEQCDSTPNCSSSCTLVCTSCPQVTPTPTPSNTTTGPLETNIINVNFAKILAH